jgi:hypothetical protein
VSRFAGHRQVVGSGAAGLVGAAGQAAMAKPVMSAQIRTAWAVVEALVLTMLDPGEGLTKSVTEESRSLPELLELYTHSITSVGLSLTERVML